MTITGIFIYNKGDVMSRRKADTTFNQLIKVLKASESEPQMLTNLIKSIEKTIPIKRGKTNMPNIDPNLNKQFRIKRINYEITAKVESFQNDINSYCIKVLKINSGETKVGVGSLLFISKRELEITGKPA